ncbi:hypothetical protein [Marinobacter alkaliphilus]|uniref:Uncharacterized protein n=1 Tax=Marinobacter alkaliphilus TaxID=254719 RepID=A0ABZ3E8I6_9GAMM
MQFANKSTLIFDPAPETVADTSAGGIVYQTPDVHRVTLGDLARLTYIKGKFRATFERDGTGETFNIKLQGGGVDIVTKEVVTNGAGRYLINENAILSQVNGEVPLSVVVEMPTGAAGSCKLSALLEVEHPIVITAVGGC